MVVWLHAPPLFPLLLQRMTDFARRDETRQRLTEQERQERNQQLQKTLTLLVHACSCHDPQCSSTSCRKVNGATECSACTPMLAHQCAAAQHSVAASDYAHVLATACDHHGVSSVDCVWYGSPLGGFTYCAHQCFLCLCRLLDSIIC
jgi:hypothetical protein